MDLTCAGKVELNVDLGELPDEPEELYDLATVVNVACGGHAGDAASMRRACALAAARGPRVAAHPSYPDREGFGRLSVSVAPSALRASVAAQCEALAEAAAGAGVEIALLKPHGALYHDAVRRPELAAALLEGALLGLGACGGRLAVVGPEAGALAAEAARLDLGYLREGFVDRGYLPDGSLVPRGAPGALLSGADACAAQALALARSGRFETLCLHADTPGALEHARAVRSALEASGLLAAHR